MFLPNQSKRKKKKKEKEKLLALSKDIAAHLYNSASPLSTVLYHIRIHVCACI